MVLLQIIFLSSLALNLSLSHKLKMKSKTKMKTKAFLKCSPLCLECSEMDPSVCNICKPGVFQYNNLCYEKCPSGTYADSDWQVCRLCDSACPVCWGPRSDMCGSIEGVRTTVVLLENEIKNYFSTKPFNNDELIG